MELLDQVSCLEPQPPRSGGLGGHTPLVLPTQTSSGHSLGRGVATQDVEVQHHGAQQPAAEGMEEVTGCRRIVRLNNVHVTWGMGGISEEGAFIAARAQPLPT